MQLVAKWKSLDIHELTWIEMFTIQNSCGSCKKGYKHPFCLPTPCIFLVRNPKLDKSKGVIRPHNCCLQLVSPQVIYWIENQAVQEHQPRQDYMAIWHPQPYLYEQLCHFVA